MLRYRRKTHKNPLSPTPPRPPGEGKELKKALGTVPQLASRIGFMMIFAIIVPNIILGYLHQPPVARVGDLLQFNQPPAPDNTPAPVVTAQSITSVFSKPGTRCVLDISTMRGPGAVMNVLAVRQDGVVLAWAGKTTAHNLGCAQNTSLFVTVENYGVLATASLPIRTFSSRFPH
jgi:hypothetical protein